MQSFGCIRKSMFKKPLLRFVFISSIYRLITPNISRSACVKKTNKSKKTTQDRRGNYSILRI